MPESALAVCWSVVVVLAVAAACNHAWHHVLDRHLAERLDRAARRERGEQATTTGGARTPVDADTAQG